MFGFSVGAQQRRGTGLALTDGSARAVTLGGGIMVRLLILTVSEVPSAQGGILVGGVPIAIDTLMYFCLVEKGIHTNSAVNAKTLPHP